MSAHLGTIVARRTALLAASQAQREQLALDVAELRGALWFVEPTARAARLATARPILLAAGAALALALGPRRLLAHGARGALLFLSVWRLGKKLRALV
jgi:hypothetical protein